MSDKDEKSLYECYKMLYDQLGQKRKPMEIEKDAAMIKGLMLSASKILAQLVACDRLDSVHDREHAERAKATYVQYAVVKGRNPECVSSDHDDLMDNMIRELCRLEAEMIRVIRLRAARESDIDIKAIFANSKHLRQLGCKTAGEIVTEAMGDAIEPGCNVPVVYITDSGKKYHRTDCPHCKGRHLTPVTREMAEKHRLSPCGCIREYGWKGSHEHVTAFIDESIRPVEWGRKGTKENTGSYSYIISWGTLKDENEIAESDIIAQGVDFSAEQMHVERLAESAVGKVLLTLAFDYDFSGKVHIYTDNQSVTRRWENVSRNTKLVGMFKEVKVSYIPREKNKKADYLCRHRMLLDMPILTYNELVRKNTYAKEMEKEILRLKTDKLTMTKTLQEMEEAHSKAQEAEAVLPVNEDEGMKISGIRGFLIRIRQRLSRGNGMKPLGLPATD